MNILELIQKSVGSELIDQASNFLGEDKNKTKSAFEAVLPSLLGSLIQKGSTQNGAASILDFMKSNNHDGGILDDFTGLFSGGDKSTGLMSSGSGILKYLIGNKLGTLVDTITSLTGIKMGSVSSILKMVGPLLMGSIGKQVSNQGLGARGLMDLLLGQKDYVSESIPAGIGQVLNLTGLSQLGTSASEDLSEAFSTGEPDKLSAIAEKEGSMASKWVPWILGILGVLLLFWLLGKGCNNTKVSEATDSVIEKTDQVIESATSAVKEGSESVVNAISSITLPSGEEIKETTGEFTEKFVTFVSSKATDLSKALIFDAVNFKTGTADLTDESQLQLDNLVKVLKAYGTINIKLQGHTDNTGSANTNLSVSKDRADAVKTYLVNHGIAANRIAAEGIGSSQPIADNGTEEGRSQNRRVVVYVTKK